MWGSGVLFPGGPGGVLLGDCWGPGAERLPSIGTVISVFGVRFPCGATVLRHLLAATMMRLAMLPNCVPQSQSEQEKTSKYRDFIGNPPNRTADSASASKTNLHSTLVTFWGSSLGPFWKGHFSAWILKYKQPCFCYVLHLTQ